MPPNDTVLFKNELKVVWPDYSTKNPTCPRSPYRFDVCEEGPLITRIGVQICHTILFIMGFIAEILRRYRLIGASRRVQEREEQRDFSQLGDYFESIYMNNIYRMASDVLDRPLCGAPDTCIKIQERDFNGKWTLELTGKTTEALNFGSYNYLGLSQANADAVIEEIDRHGLHASANDYEFSNSELERQLRRFLGVESVVVFPNGFEINSSVMPRLADSNTLILSDQLNHFSLLLGMRLSGASIVVFNHNSMDDLESKLRTALSSDLASKTPSIRKILIVVEGIYSMEGTIVNLPRLIEIKRKYEAYLFIDEAHSIGALGPKGRGVVDYWGADPKQVDILMGTFTKSFGSAGGYIAGRKEIIDLLRQTSPSRFYSAALAPPLVRQVITSMKIMMNEDVGRERNERLVENTRYFRRRLKELNLIVYGHDAPIISVITFYMPKAVCFGREALKRGLVVCSVGYPATPLNKARIRFCISSEHTKQQMDQAIEIADICAELAGIKYKQTQCKK